MSTSYLQCLNQMATYFKISPGKLYLEDNLIPVCTQGDRTTRGFLNILNDFIALAKSSVCVGSREDKAEIYQWIDYCIVYATQCNSTQNTQQILSELNEVLAIKTYLVGYRMTLADILLYYILFNVMQSISYLEKEKYMNVSRWFDNMQQDPSLRQKNKVVDFKTNYLVATAPARH